MPKIHILPDILSNKIAAGEVVERPASVVKELLENAIDAGGSRIFVDIENGGRSLIRVSDNGHGMNRDDALLSIERYATSKIYTDADLFAIRTLGFRGEALPSIASVSRFSLTTRDQESDAGTCILIEGGKIRDVVETGAPVGTMIDVKNLFFNTPARRKFLKSAQTEMGHILETISAIALGCPGIAFQLAHNGKKIKNWPLSSDPLDRASSVLGQNVRQDLHRIQMETTAVNLHGWISSPHLTRSTSQKIYLYVNGRYIRDRGLQHALFEGYRGRLMKGRFPIAVLFITVPHEQLDVNVHPTKHEVRFTGYRTVYETLKKAVFNAWNVLDHKKEFSTSPSVPQHLPADAAEPPALRTPHRDREIPFRRPVQPPAAMPSQPEKQIQTVSETQAVYSPPEPVAAKIPVHHPSAVQQKDTAPIPEDAEALRIIGQLHNTFIVCESGQGLVLFDQHAAHERILFEYLKKKSGTAGARSQKLLIPEMIDLGYKESVTLEKIIPGLLQFGLEIEPFGGTTFAVKAVPALLSDREVTPLIIEIIEKTDDIGFAEGIEKSLDECLILMACHGSIRANQSLSEKEMQGLVRQLAQCENPSHCPHGRPIRITWPVADIEKKFKRIV